MQPTARQNTQSKQTHAANVPTSTVAYSIARRGGKYNGWRWGLQHLPRHPSIQISLLCGPPRVARRPSIARLPSTAGYSRGPKLPLPCASANYNGTACEQRGKYNPSSAMNAANNQNNYSARNCKKASTFDPLRIEMPPRWTRTLIFHRFKYGTVVLKGV